MAKKKTVKKKKTTQKAANTLNGMHLNAMTDVTDFRDRIYEPPLIPLKREIPPLGIGRGRSAIPLNQQTRFSSAAGGFLDKAARGNPNREVVADNWVGWPFAGTNTAIRDDRGARSRFGVCHRAFALAPVGNTSRLIRLDRRPLFRVVCWLRSWTTSPLTFRETRCPFFNPINCWRLQHVF